MCSTAPTSSEVLDTATWTSGSAKAVAPCASSRRTPRKASCGTQPLLLTSMASICRFKPLRCCACSSNQGRNTSIRGTITKCKALHNSPSASAKSANAPTSQRPARAAKADLGRGDGVFSGIVQRSKP